VHAICYTLQHTAKRWNLLQCGATRCNSLQLTATHCIAPRQARAAGNLEHASTHHNNTLQLAVSPLCRHVLTRCKHGRTLQLTATHCNPLYHPSAGTCCRQSGLEIAANSGIDQVAVCCSVKIVLKLTSRPGRSVLQSVAVCCYVMQ